MRVGHIALLTLLLAGCYVIKPAKIPLPVVHYSAATNGTAEGLIVLLPGFGDGPNSFDQQGIIDIVRRIAPTFDAVATDAHFAYYRNQSIVERLHNDVIEPIAHRYQRVWLVGISMGGLGAAAYAMEHPAMVEGVILLAPYMGDDELIAELEAAGGLAQWLPPDLAAVVDEEERLFYELWTWYKGYADVVYPAPKLLLGFGAEDRLRRANQLVVDVLPGDQVVSIPGGHKWTVWIPLFETLLRRAVAKN